MTTDAEILAYLHTLPRDHYTAQWFVDALAPESPSHPHRRANARREVERIMTVTKETR